MSSTETRPSAARSPTRSGVAALVDRGGPPRPDSRHGRRPDAADAARARRRRHRPLELLRRPLRPDLPLDPLHLGLDLRRRATEADERGRTIRDFHTEIKGTDDHGRRYHALDPEIFWWAHATFTWEFFRAHELYFPGRLRRGRTGAALRRDRHLVPALRRQRPRRTADPGRLPGPLRPDLRPRAGADPGGQLGPRPRDEPGTVGTAAPSRARSPSSTGSPPTSGRRCSDCSCTAACPTSFVGASTSGGRTATGSSTRQSALRCRRPTRPSGAARCRTRGPRELHTSTLLVRVG